MRVLCHVQYRHTSSTECPVLTDRMPLYVCYENFSTDPQPTRCPVQRLRALYAMCGADLWYAVTRLVVEELIKKLGSSRHVCYAMSSTGVGYGY